MSVFISFFVFHLLVKVSVMDLVVGQIDIYFAEVYNILQRRKLYDY